MVTTLKCIVKMLAIKTRVVEGLQDKATTMRTLIVNHCKMYRPMEF